MRVEVTAYLVLGGLLAIFAVIGTIGAVLTLARAATDVHSVRRSRWSFDGLSCHDHDEEGLIGYLRTAPINTRQNQRTDNIGASR